MTRSARYFLQHDNGPVKLVSKREFIAAERAAGYRPKLPSSDPRYKTLCATSGFSNGPVTGIVEYSTLGDGRPQDPKYDFCDGRVINRDSGELVPLDEDVFVFRARDVLSLPVLKVYRSLVRDLGSPGVEAHLQAIDERIAHFEQFRHDHPERMKEPDTDVSAREQPGL